jgi:hypothetical protein
MPDSLAHLRSQARCAEQRRRIALFAKCDPRLGAGVANALKRQAPYDRLRTSRQESKR